MSLLALAAAAAVVAGAALQSAIGFGFALVAAPLLYAALSPPEAVGLLIVLGMEVNLLTLLGERRRPAPSWPDVIAVVAWSLPGSLAGVALLRALDEVALQLLVTAGVLVALAINLRPPRTGPVREPHAARAAAGLTSGALNTSTSTGGPPLVLLLMGRGLSPATVRDTLTTSFLAFAPVGVLALVLTGTDEAIPPAWSVALLVPLVVAGHLAGRRVFARLATTRRYERVLAVALVATAAAGLITVLA